MKSQGDRADLWIPAAVWRDAAAIFVAVFAAYSATMIAFGHFGTSPVSYFDLLAWSFIHGRTDLIDPKATADLANYHGLWYVPFPPLPALLMLPGISVLGPDRFNVGAFVAAAGAAAASGVYLLLQQLGGLGITRLTRGDNQLLALAFAFGTINWYMATTSNVWYVAQVSTYLFAILALVCVAGGASPVWAGIALGLAAMGRPHIVAMLPLIIALRIARDKVCSARWVVTLLAPVGAAAVVLALYNLARFGAPGEFGYRYALGHDWVARDFLQYGQFSTHFLLRNTYTMFLELPRWNPHVSFWTPRLDGMSIALTMPFGLWVVRARSEWPPLVRAAWASVALGLCPPLLYYAPMMQFGARYFLDVMPAVVVLVALAVAQGVTRSFRIAVALSMIVNAAGTIWWHWPR